jgi:hypothetical protein
MSEPVTTTQQRVAMMNGARPKLSEYVDELEITLQDLLISAEIEIGEESSAVLAAHNILNKGKAVIPIVLGTKYNGIR